MDTENILSKIKNSFEKDKDRFTTGILILGVVILVGIFNSFLTMWAFFGIIYFIAIYESMKLFNIDDLSVYGVGAIIWGSLYFYPSINIVFVIGIVIASILAYTQKVNKKVFLPLLYPTVSFIFMLTLYNEFGILALVWLLLLVALTDIFAYFVGKAIGKTKFCETSPKKTLEGVAGGVIIASIVGAIFGITYVDFLTSILISLFVSIASVFGDLYESYLKRKANVKDSGDILPGHGGILDRVDGYLFGAPILFILLDVLN